jgi:regulatory protein
MYWVREAPVGKITKIEAQKKNKNRVSVFVDGEYRGSLSLITCAQTGLREGDELNDARWQEIERIHEAQQAFEQGLRYLDSRMRSHREMRDYLRRKGYSDEAADSAREKLAQYGYLDDAEFARLWVRDRASVRRSGRWGIEQELLARGVDRDTIALALDEYTPELEQENARAEFDRLRRRYGQVADPAALRQKIGASLMRRGFDWDTIRPLLDSLGDDGEPCD